jgi:hypothetical protein
MRQSKGTIRRCDFCGKEYPVTTRPAGSAAILAISHTVLGKVVSRLTREQFERERMYRVAMAIAKSMLQQELINAEDYAIIDTIMMQKYRPILSGIYPENHLIQSAFRGNMRSTKER